MAYIRSAEGTVAVREGNPEDWGTCPRCSTPVLRAWLEVAGGCGLHRQCCYCDGQCGATEHMPWEEFTRRIRVQEAEVS